MQKQQKDKILVIKLGALGDFIQALGPMKAIRSHHPHAHITLITTKTFEIFGKKSDYFDDIWIDDKPKIHQPLKWLALRKKLTSAHFSRIYDLQNNDRTALYFKLFPKSKRPEWVGAAKGASHENNHPDRTSGHAFDGHKMTLALAGIDTVEIDTLDWLKGKGNAFNIPTPFTLLITGCSPQHPQKRWPAEKYAALANHLLQRGQTPVLIGTADEREINHKISSLCPKAVNLTEKTSLFDIATLAHNADFAIGNDTGPIHMAGPTGCKTLVLFSSHSTPSKHAPKGANIYTIQQSNLNDLKLETVIEKLYQEMGMRT